MSLWSTSNVARKLICFASKCSILFKAALNPALVAVSPIFGLVAYRYYGSIFLLARVALMITNIRVLY